MARQESVAATTIVILLGLSTPALAFCTPSSYCSMYKNGECVVHTTTTCPPPPPPSIYGAIAYSPSSDRFGYSYNYISRGPAENRALSECGQNDCVVAAWFYNRCGALATSSTGAWGGAQDASAERARSKALQICADHGGTDCDIKTSLCSPK
jgi:hypothetical protein